MQTPSHFIFLLISLLYFQFCHASSFQSYSTVEIAPREQALTFARISSQNQFTTLGVVHYENGQLRAVDLNDALNAPSLDPISLFNSFGYEAIKSAIDESSATKILTVPADQLTLPANFLQTHIAVGTNYKAHAEETDVTRTPFLFSKRVEPTAPYANVPLHSNALDWEVELAFVPLKDLSENTQPEFMGLILTNDFSNREILMHNVNINHIESAKGFAEGKSGIGLLPVGNLFIIPKDFRTFSNNIALSLSVNDQLKQQAFSQQMIWDADQILNEIWLAKDKTWNYQKNTIGLLKNKDRLPARTLILSGTPEGTAFQGVPISTKLKGVGKWIGSGFNSTVQFHVVNTYLEESYKQKRFLQVGDQVNIHANYLGVLSNIIGERITSQSPSPQMGMQ